MAFFKIVKLDSPPPATGRRCAYLFEDRWDDWGKYRTQFRLIVFDESGNRFEPGDVKIAELGLQPLRMFHRDFAHRRSTRNSTSLTSAISRSARGRRITRPLTNVPLRFEIMS